MKNVSLLVKNMVCRLLVLVSLAMTVLSPTPARAIVPVNGVPPMLTPVTINDGAGDQYDPHVSGDWVSYTSDLSIHSIRYYSFATNTDAQIPLGSSARDLLSDVSSSKIVFSRIIPSVKTAVMVFDAADPAAAPIEIDAALGTLRIGSVIGGNTVAYIDFGLTLTGELIIHDLASSTSVRATNDVAFDGNPSVSPGGNVVTWEHCAISTTNCDIWQAVKSGAVWSVGVASNTANPEANPDTNGTLVVHDSALALGPGSTNKGEIFWRPITGGPEVQLQLPSVEANPSIAGNLIAFESRPTLLATSDIFVYDITTNLLYQITNTPLGSEQLNDITVLPDGSIRTVWSIDENDFEDGSFERNVYSATFSLPDNTPPVITPSIAGTLGNNGWFVSDVTVSWTVEDNESAVTATSGCDATTITTDTAGTTLSCEATSDGGTASESVTIRHDATAPSLAPSVSPNPVTLNGSATASPNASDALSGIATSGCDAVDTASVGPKTASCMATDQAGNTANALADYTVVYAFAGFVSSVDNPPVLNVAKAGQAVSLKWRLTDADGAPVTGLASVTVTAVSLACPAGTTLDQIEEYASGGSGLQNLGDGNYQFNWKTPKSYANSCKTVMLDIGEGVGQEDTALFQLKQ